MAREDNSILGHSGKCIIQNRRIIGLLNTGEFLIDFHPG
jgi:hypothetical protein